MNAEILLRAMFDAAVAKALPGEIVREHLPEPPSGRTAVLGLGKAAASMAAAFEDAWEERHGAEALAVLEGLAIARYGHSTATRRVEVVEAAHPVPDAAGEAAARRLLELAGALGPDDLAVVLVSGGGSALASVPAPGLSLEDKRAVTQALLRSGANIAEMNAVRKHLSLIKGGRLAAAAAPARVVALMISDVPGDDLSVIASGPTVPDASTRRDALSILGRYGIEAPASVRAWLDDEACETPKPGDPVFERVTNALIATPQASLEAAAAVARANGYAPYILGDAIEGEAREVAKVMAGIAKQVAGRGQPFAPPCALISGGETTVTVRGKGRGGRNVEFLTALALELGGLEGVFAIAGDTDGVDGAEEVAGAVIGPATLERAASLNVDVKAALANNDGHGLFETLSAQVVTGPTLTNVNDFRAILIERR